MPKISVIVPVYCAETYLEKCIECILAQTFLDLELLLVDDGSPDNSGIICDSYANRDSRVRVIHKKNGGVSSARNEGLKQATGTYVMFCDSDDFVDPSWCIELYTIMEDKNVDIGICGYSYVDSEGKDLNRIHIFSNESVSVLLPKSIWNIYYQCFLNMPWNKIFRKSIIDKHGITFKEGLQYNEDLLFVLDYLLVGNVIIGMVNKPLYHYRQDVENSLTRRHIPNLWQIKNEVFGKLDETLELCGVEIDTIAQEYYSKWCWAICESISHLVHKDNPAGFIQKYLKLFTILHSEECKTAFSKGEFQGVSGLYRSVLKTRCALLVYCYIAAAELKGKYSTQ